MLVSFSVANFRSFGEEVTLNMVASNKLTDHLGHRVPIGNTGKHVLRAAVMYGANAAGKSNLVRAMAVAQRLIRERTERIATVEPFRFHGSNVQEPSSFEFRFLLNDRVFIYGFDILRNKFSAEWLAFVNGDDEVVIFERNDAGKTDVNSSAKRHFSRDHVMFTALNTLASLELRNDQLFLNRAASLPESALGSSLASIIRWLTHDLLILQAQHRTDDILKQLSDDASFRSFCSQFLEHCGTGIRGLNIEETVRESTAMERSFLELFGTMNQPFVGGVSADSATLIRQRPEDPAHIIVRSLVTEHPTRTDSFALPFSEESDGTQQLLHFMPVLFSPDYRNRIVVIDELDRSLHPMICWEFIRFFSEVCQGARKQLIVTTHEAHLLNQELLRRDEYWFVEKDSSQQSRLVSLSEFNARNDLQLQKGYLQGRFGAIPVIGSMDELEKLLECRSPEASNATQEATA